MGPLSALLVAALGTAAPTRAAADAAVVDEAVASAPRRDDGPRDPFVMIPVREAEVERPAPPPPPDPPPRASVVQAPLRDPFLAPLPHGTREISADLKDPFSLPPSSRKIPLRPIRDLRDPFVPRPEGAQPGACSSGGVPVQRPKSMPAPVKRCPGHDAPLLNPFSAA
ncbi:MAG TPA: hypothetical protein VG755_14015 [Nannocystaceae bacterium]|nr:hypothetical protein [Nannocystaceae bacterium]